MQLSSAQLLEAELLRYWEHWEQQITGDESNLQSRLGIINGFIFGFAGILSIMTVAKPFDVLAAIAAYSAVLVLFMQLGCAASSSGV